MLRITLRIYCAHYNEIVSMARQLVVKLKFDLIGTLEHTYAGKSVSSKACLTLTRVRSNSVYTVSICTTSMSPESTFINI
jgi:hypothetical protein